MRTDTDRGLRLLGIFTAATVIAVGAVVLAAAVERYWILVPAMAIHLTTSAVVFAAIMQLVRQQEDGDHLGHGH